MVNGQGLKGLNAQKLVHGYTFSKSINALNSVYTFSGMYHCFDILCVNQRQRPRYIIFVKHGKIPSWVVCMSTPWFHPLHRVSKILDSLLHLFSSSVSQAWLLLHRQKSLYLHISLRISKLISKVIVKLCRIIYYQYLLHSLLSVQSWDLGNCLILRSCLDCQGRK